MARGFADIIVKIVEFALAQPAAPAERRAEYERFAGRFVNDWGVLDVAHFGDVLVALDPEEDDPVKHVTELRIEEGDTLHMTQAGGYASPGETIRYVWDGTARVSKIICGGSSRYPVEIYRERYLAVQGASAG